jgi:tetratricopeptide (TPR) repeat protein
MTKKFGTEKRVTQDLSEKENEDRINVFVGRESELKMLNNYLSKASKGSGSFILIRGEAGTGKTRLLNQFAKEARSKNAIYLSEKFDKSNSFNPYYPFLKVIQKVFPIKFQQNKFDELFPKLKSRVPIENKFLDVESFYHIQSERNLVQQKIVSALKDASENQILLIEFLDVHNASLTSWQFLHYLSHSLLEQKIVVILSLRQDGRISQPSEVPLYADVLQRMNRESLIEIIQLNRFSLEEVRKYLNHIFPRSDFSSRLVSNLFEISSGLPDQLGELINFMLDKGIIFQQKNVWFNQEKIDPEFLTTYSIDEHIRNEVSNQLQVMDNVKLTILQFAALMDTYLYPAILAQLCQLKRHHLLKELLSLQDQKLIYEEKDGSFCFKKTIIRSIIVEQLSQNQKMSMRGKIVGVIDSTNQIDDSQKIYLLAHLYTQIGNSTKAFEYLYKAGEKAVKNLALPEAVEYYSSAIGFSTDNANQIPYSKSAPLFLKTAWLNRVLGNWEESLKQCQRLRSICDLESNVDILNQILIQEGLTYFRLNKWENAKRCFEQCLASKEKSSLFDQAMATYGLGNIYFEISQYSLAEQHYQSALSSAQKINSKYLMANIYNNLGAIRSIQGDRLNAIALYSQGITLFTEISDNYGVARLYNNIGMTYADENNWEKANEFYGKSLTISDQFGFVPMKAITFLNRALALSYLREFEEAREYNFKALRLLSRLKDELGLAEYYKIQGMIEREQKNWSQAKTFFQDAIEKYESLNNQLGCAETEYELGLLEYAKSNLKQMKKRFEESIARYKMLGIEDKINLVKSKMAELQKDTMHINEESITK